MTTPPEVAAARHMASRSSSSSIPKDTFSNKSQQNRHQHHRDPIYRYSSLAAGIASGIVSSLVVAPLDLIRTRLQIFHSSTPPSANIGSGSSAASSAWRMLRDILQKEGIKGCFRGLTATLITVPVFWGVYFPLYDECKWYLTHHPPAPLANRNELATNNNNINPALVHMGSAVAAGIVADVLCNPAFVVRTRLMTEAVHQNRQWAVPSTTIRPSSGHNSSSNNPPHSTIAQTVRALFAEGGWPIFWRGMSANLLGLSHVAVQFPVYERLKHQILMSNPDQHQLSATDLLVASGLSKMTASLLTYPHEVIRSRMMDARTAGKVQFRATCRTIFQRDGMAGFYAGLPVSLLRVIPNTCLTFVTYELVLRWSRQHFLETTADTHATARSGG